MHSSLPPRARIASGAEHFGIHLNDETLSRFDRFIALLTDWNTRMNLVSTRDMTRLVEYHILDSLKIASVFDFFSVKKVLDFGSGAGFPGAPLAIAFPHLRTTLLDSREKRARFLSFAVETLPLPNASVLHSRIENTPPSYRGGFDVVVTRATVRLPDFYSLASHLVSPGGTLISIKGDSIEHEYPDLVSCVDSRLFHTYRVTPSPFPGVRRGQIVFIKKK